MPLRNRLGLSAFIFFPLKIYLGKKNVEFDMLDIDITANNKEF